VRGKRFVTRAGRPVAAVAVLTIGLVSPALAAPVGQPTLRQLGDGAGISIGSAVRDYAIQQDSRYAGLLGAQYGMVTPENEMKWATVHPWPYVYNYGPADDIVSFAVAHHMQVRGHTLVWYQQNPTWLTNGAFNRSQLIAILKSHILNVVGHYRGKVSQWDVVNEAFDDHGHLRHDVWLDGIGPDYIAMAFRWAHQADPGAKLYYNDFGFEEGGAKADAIYSMVAGLRAQGVPIDGVGFQMHISDPDDFNSARLAGEMARFNRLGLAVAVTEMDVWLRPPGAGPMLDEEAGIFRGALADCRSAADCHTFVTWGFTDRYSWVSETSPPDGWALPFDSNYAPKPAVGAIEAALR